MISLYEVKFSCRERENFANKKERSVHFILWLKSLDVI